MRSAEHRESGVENRESRTLLRAGARRRLIGIVSQRLVKSGEQSIDAHVLGKRGSQMFGRQVFDCSHHDEMRVDFGNAPTCQRNTIRVLFPRAAGVPRGDARDDGHRRAAELRGQLESLVRGKRPGDLATQLHELDAALPRENLSMRFHMSLPTTGRIVRPFVRGAASNSRVGYRDCAHGLHSQAVGTCP